MNKRNLLTALGIALALAIAAGGWILTSTLINRESDALLSAIVITPLEGAPATSPTETSAATATEAATNPLEGRPRLNADEINAILQYWSVMDEERPHEPFGGQLSMKQAIEAGKAGLSSLASRGVLPAELLETTFEKPHAYLAQMQPESSVAAGEQPPEKLEALNPAYSYWTVTLTNEGMGAILIINAVTAQIWIADIDIYSANIEFGALNIEDALKAFVSYLQMDSTEKINSSQENDHAFAYLQLAEGKLILDVDMNATQANGRTVLSRVTLALHPSWPGTVTSVQ